MTSSSTERESLRGRYLETGGERVAKGINWVQTKYGEYVEKGETFGHLVKGARRSRELT